MGNIFNRISLLCDEKGVTPSRMCLDIGLSKSLITEIKSGRTKQLSASTATKISDYFAIPTDFLLDRPPFDYWEKINADRKKFLSHILISADALQTVWNISADNPQCTPIRDFLYFLFYAVESAVPVNDNVWDIKLKLAYKVRNMEKEKAPASEGERKVSDEDIKFALWGDTSNITDDDLEDVKRYAAFIRERKRRDD